jgi:putative ABC transport system substrate-binding protein
VHRIGILSGAVPDPAFDGLRQALPELGYAEGRDIVLDSRFAEGRPDRLPGLAAELLERKPDVIVTITLSAALAAKKATTTVPIVFTIVADPVDLGLVPSLARPGGNLTGTAELQAELTGKRFDLFKQALPSLKSLVLLVGPNPYRSYLKESEVAARRLGLEGRVIELQDPINLEFAFGKFVGGPSQGIVLVPDPFLFTHRTKIAEFAIKRRAPLLGWQSQLTTSGALMSYGANHFESGRHAAVYVAKILKGAKPADLPVERAANFELVINMTTAKALGLKLSDSFLVRADKVIE